MLLRFKCENFKSFRDGFVFNMMPDTRKHELKYSIIKRKVGSKDVKALSASVIYGPNAAGKTSVINAMSCFREIVLRGNIRNTADDRTTDHVSHDMSLIPFAFQEDEKPITFDISFFRHGVKYRYKLSAKIGTFLNAKKNRTITIEELYVNDDLVYKRDATSVSFLSLKAIKTFLNNGVTNDVEKEESIKISMSSNIVPDSLLLVTDFNSFCSKKVVEEIREWFSGCFMVLNSSNRVRFTPTDISADGKAFIDETINLIAKEAGITGSDFAYAKDSETQATKIMSIIKKDSEKLYGLDADLIESLGTLRLIYFMPVVISALQRGGVLIVDELDASLHPMIVMNLISIFHNDEVNVNGAQIIFNTHNPIYLNRRLLRRDEIKFVERDPDSKSSELYSLADFATNGESSVRNTTDYMKNYFINRYGAILDIDFTDIIARLLHEESKQ